MRKIEKETKNDVSIRIFYEDLVFVFFNEFRRYKSSSTISCWVFFILQYFERFSRALKDVPKRAVSDLSNLYCYPTL